MPPVFNFGMNELIAAITLGQLIIFFLFLLLSQYRQSPSNKILCFVFFILMTAKVDQIYQMQGGMLKYPEFSFTLVPLQMLIAPALYFFVYSKTNADFRFRIKYFLHFIPAAMLYIYYGYLLAGLRPDEIRALMDAGVITGVVDNLIIPAIGDVIQIVYILAGLNILKSHGVAFKNWFSGNEDEVIKGLKILLLIWVFIFIAHFMVITLSAVAEIGLMRRVIFEVMNVLHLLLVNALMLAGVVGHLKWPASHNSSVMAVKYASSNLSNDERHELFKVAQKFLVENRYYLNAELTIGQLADQIAATPRELSEAINGIGGQSFFEFVNKYRIEAAAKRLLIDESDTILRIAMASGFNSKSSFNTLFKKQMGITPSQYRKQKP